jgi:hypothetical protein
VDPADREALARRSIEAWNADDWEEQLSALWSPDGTIVSPEGWPESGEFRGWPAMVEQRRRVAGERLSKMTYFLDPERARTAAEAPG